MLGENIIHLGANIIGGGGGGGVALDHTQGLYVLVPIDDSGAVKDGSHSIDLIDLGEHGVELHVQGGDKPIVAPGDQKYLSIDGARRMLTIEGTAGSGITLDGEQAKKYTATLAMKRYPRSQYT